MCVCVCVCVCVRAALVIRHAKRMRPIILSFVASRTLTAFFVHYIINGTVLGKEMLLEHKMCVLIFLSNFCPKYYPF